MTIWNRQNPSYFWPESDKDIIVSTCKRNWPEEITAVLHRADLACQNSFIFTHRWDMERCETPVSFSEKIDWTYRFNEDFEWTVMLNRARYMAELGQAYWMSGDEKYVLAYIRLMKEWMAENPLTEEEVLASEDRHYNVKDTWRKLDSGIRIVNWMKGYYCIRQSTLWGEKEESLFQEAVKLHGMYLNRAFTTHDKQSNWGFLETNGLFQMGLLFPKLDGADQWLQTAIDRLEIMVNLQIFEDGMHNEQCTMYHHEVLHCLFESVLLADKNGLTYPKVLKEKLNRMFDASLLLVKPNGHQPMLSDSDDTDIRDVLCHGAILFQRGDLKSRSYSSVDYDGIWYFGHEGISTYDRIEAHDPDYVSKDFEQAGYSIMRSDWAEKARYLLFDGGHMDLIRAHGHDDFLHIELSAFGREFLTDSGRYTYMENEDRKYFKESLQHNTISVDGLTISAYEDSWSWSQVAMPINKHWKTHPDFDYVQAGHNGYWKLEKPVHVLRQVLFVKPDYWVLIDTCQSNGMHEYEQHFHFAEEVPVEVDSRNGVVQTTFNEGANLRIIPVTQSNVRLEKCWISRHYNQKTESSKVIYKQVRAGFTKFVSVLYPQQDSNKLDLEVSEIDVKDTFGRSFSAKQLTALEVKRSESSEIILVSHEGPNSYHFEDIHLSGEVILIRREKGEKEKSYVIKV